ncbi:protein-L-isoaspartate O-methyltransferase family protein [Symbioplanes lichenis]|uniref:protein-L-isoaspartate O-methyltransferase family protein n=1 Tax=Symbioplanes lichenis TaxID=1629072 RepID=UPI00273883B4|nr:methyltransferase domain-containing protein [Actinoplanes lichenis]
MADLGQRFVAEIERDGGPLPPELAAAFASVPREVFVAEGFQRRDGTWASPGSAGFLDAVYQNDVLVTKVAGGVPVSSSSQPSLMAIMLEALDVRPGQRVLEIGAGTGYNAALMRALGAEVTSVDVQEDVAARARSVLVRAGIDGVRVLTGDGYEGSPGETFDRVIVTVAVSGLSPRWFEQVGEGPVVAPVEHAGSHPVLLARRAATGEVVAQVVCASGFMSAAGPLLARHPRSHPAPVDRTDTSLLEQAAPARWAEAVGPMRYRDLQYAAGVWHERATQAPLSGQSQNPLVLLDEAGTGGAAILPDGSVLATGEDAARYAREAGELLDRWEAAGQPSMAAWQIRMALTDDPATPIWYPAEWQLRPGTQVNQALR